MAYSFSLDDVAFLRSAEGRRVLDECSTLALSKTSRVADIAQAKKICGPYFAAVVETVELRRKAVSKIDDAAEWLFTGEALQQASATLVARHRASRLQGRSVHDVTCSIGADLVELAKMADDTTGSDIDDVRLAMADHNCAIANVSPTLRRADALVPITKNAVVVADPARRDSAGRRSLRPQDFTPPLDELISVYSGRDLVIKCAPGLSFTTMSWAAEIELVSLDGQVREACLWSPGLATASRRATVLRSDSHSWTITDSEPDDIPTSPPGQWIIEPDGAVIRAGLVRHYAARHNLWQLDERIAYLTGNTPPPGTRAFRILDSFPFREKHLRALLRQKNVGRLEILTRGLDLDPDDLRRRLKLQGSEEVTVILTRIGTSPQAFLCHPERIPW